MGSRRPSGESSGMMSMGSIGTNFNEGTDAVQKPLVREFKTQGRLNRGIMPPGNNAKEESATTLQKLTNSNNLSRKCNALVDQSGGGGHSSNLAKKASPRPVTQAIASVTLQANAAQRANRNNIKR